MRTQLKTLTLTLRVCLAIIIALCASTSSAFAKPHEVKMDRALQRKLNTFMSNFSEGYVEPFVRGKFSHDQLIRFAVHHEWINRKSKNSGAPIPAERVKSLALWYFGIDVKKHRSTADANYRNGKYYFTMGDGDPLPFAQVSKMVDMGKGEFVVYTNEYSTHSADTQADSRTWNRGGDEDKVWKGGKRRGTIKQVGSGTRRRYILLDYQKIQ